MKKHIFAVGCLIEHDGKMLVLQRQPHKRDGGKWGIPAGTVEQNEEKIPALVREIQEETGYTLPVEEVDFLGEYHFEYPDLAFDISVYRVQVAEKISVTLDPKEHQAFDWLSAQEIFATPEEELRIDFHKMLELLGYQRSVTQPKQ